MAQSWLMLQVPRVEVTTSRGESSLIQAYDRRFFSLMDQEGKPACRFEGRLSPARVPLCLDWSLFQSPPRRSGLGSFEANFPTDWRMGCLSPQN